MNIVRPSSTLDSSATSSQVDSIEDTETIKAKNYVKDLLKSRIFLGQYLERRLVDQRIGYRDVILLSSAEVDMKRDLIETQYKLRLAFPRIYWIGITDADPLGYPSNVCIWTEIDNQPFGPFWFQIKTIKFRDDEIMIALKCIRHISDSFLEIEPILTGSAKKCGVVKQVANTNESQPDSSTSLSETYNEIVETLKGALSIRNVKEFVTFVFAFVIAVFTGSTAFVNFIGNFVLALIREISIFVKNSTPLFLGFLDFLSKIVGGFYILLAMFFRPSNPVPQDRRAVGYNTRTHRPSREYDSRCFD